MSSPLTSVYNGVTPEKWAKITADLAANGLSVSGNNGEIDHMGVSATYSYDGVDNLSITVTKAPFFIGIGGASKRIEDAVNKELAS